MIQLANSLAILPHFPEPLLVYQAKIKKNLKYISAKKQIIKYVSIAKYVSIRIKNNNVTGFALL